MPLLADSEFSLVHTPAAATQATKTIAAAGPGIRHVLRSLVATLATGATAQAVAATVVVRDGATGVGAIIWAQQVIIPANIAWTVMPTDLLLAGSPNTAMTLEFTAAGVAGSFESISGTGYDRE
jgi:hypothetical protein